MSPIWIPQARAPRGRACCGRDRRDPLRSSAGGGRSPSSGSRSEPVHRRSSAPDTASPIPPTCGRRRACPERADEARVPVRRRRADPLKLAYQLFLVGGRYDAIRRLTRRCWWPERGRWSPGRAPPDLVEAIRREPAIRRAAAVVRGVLTGLGEGWPAAECAGALRGPRSRSCDAKAVHGHFAPRDGGCGADQSDPATADRRRTAAARGGPAAARDAPPGVGAAMHISSGLSRRGRWAMLGGGRRATGVRRPPSCHAHRSGPPSVAPRSAQPLVGERCED
jgi:hypothetical protein